MTYETSLLVNEVRIFDKICVLMRKYEGKMANLTTQ